MANDFSVGHVKRDPIPPGPVYIHQKFPSWRFHKTGKEALVKSQAESDALGEGWSSNLPTAAEIEQATAPPEVKSVVPPEAPPCGKCAALEARFNKSFANLSKNYEDLAKQLKTEFALRQELGQELQDVTGERDALKQLVHDMEARDATPEAPPEQAAAPAVPDSPAPEESDPR